MCQINDPLAANIHDITVTGTTLTMSSSITIVKSRW
ncbi:hypothetical protein SLEP1_g51620 [Rubroshorea leprosula]|nr:hypothetical protein SLEP1_g51620 [Rubroshorea leprosula]